MSESKLEKVLKTLKRKFCDWGLSRPVKSEGGSFGESAPVWKSPAPKLFMWLGVFSVLVFIVELFVMAFTEQFEGECGGGILATMNCVVFWYFLNGLVLLYISRNETGTDKQWSRYIAISSGSNLLLLGFSLGLAAFLFEGESCSDDTIERTCISLVLLSFILVGLFGGLIAYTIIKLYFREDPLAYNEES